MSKFKAFLGIVTAVLMLPLSMMTLMGLTTFPETLVEITGLEISPWYTGGEVVRTVARDGYELRIHRPVFDALIGQRREGFVQVVWGPLDALPETVEDSVDYDNDGLDDFRVTLRPGSKTAEWQPLDDHSFGLEGPYAIGDGMGVRIQLERK